MKLKTRTAVHKTVSASMRSLLNKTMTAAIICSVVILTLCPYAHSQRRHRQRAEIRFEARCGDEFRIETQDGTTFQGRLLSNNGNLLTLRHGASGLHTIALEDVTSAFRVKRRTGSGILLGSVLGASVGGVAAKIWYDKEKKKEQRWLWIPIAEIAGMIIGGTLVGGIVGGIIGHSTQKLGPVQLEALPMCASASGGLVPIKINLSINF